MASTATAMGSGVSDARHPFTQSLIVLGALS